MFSGVGRRLALLNAVVVIAVIAIAGAATFFALRRSLDNEIDSSLRSRLEPVIEQPFVGDGSNSRSEDGEESDGEDDEERHEFDEDVLSSGDTIVFVVDQAGNVVFNPREIALEGVPVRAGIERALNGRTDVRSVSVEPIGRVRVLSMPVLEDRQVVGAGQAIRSLAEHERELQLVGWMTLAGMGLGAFVAVPAGLYLANRAMRPIRRAFDRQRMFVADASHELRTPLTLIRANAEYALQEPDAPVCSVQSELTSILEEVDRTDRLSDDLLTLARADAGQLSLQFEVVDFVPLVRDAVARLQMLDPTRELTLTIDSSAACRVNVDRDRIIQVVRILIDNAMQHTPADGRIAVAVSCQDRQAMLAVRDRGAGIAPEHLDRVFDRFYRVDRARSRATGGTGLGLSIAKALVEAHGGRISLTSQLGVGTEVTVSLPVI